MANLKLMFYKFSIFLVWLMLTVTSAQATKSVESILEFRGTPDHVYKDIEFLPILDMVDPWRRPRVKRSLAEGECGISLNQLYQTILNRYPEIPSPFNSVQSTRAWSGYVLPRYYPDLRFCRVIKSFRKYDAMAASGEDERRFLPQSRDRAPGHLVSMNKSRVFYQVGALIVLAIEDYAPAQIMLARLSSEERHLRLTPAYAYYLLSRAKMNQSDDADLAPLYADAKAALSDKGRVALDLIINSGDWPPDWPLVID